MLRRAENLLWQSLVLAALYAALGTLGLVTAISPGFTMPLSPAAGVALGAVMVWGLRILPGIYLGSALLQVAACLHAGLPVTPLLVLAIPVGACAQAACGAMLARQLRIWPGALDETRPVALFLGVVAPASCLIGATAASLIQALCPATEAGADLFNWMNWWAGDILGVMLATPIYLAMMTRPANQWVGRRTMLGVPLMLATLVCAAALMLVRQREEVRIYDDFMRSTEHVESDLRNSLRNRLDVLLALERHVALDPNLSAEDWTQLTQPWLDRYSNIINLTWNPRLERSQLAEFEARQRQEGRPGFTLRDRDAQGNLGPPGPQAEFFPITYVEPLRGNEKAVGMNPASSPASEAAIARTRQSGQPAASRPFPLVQGLHAEPGIVVYQAVRKLKDSSPADQPRGIVSSAMRIGDLVRDASREVDRARIVLCLTDHTHPQEVIPLYGPPDCAATPQAGSVMPVSRQIRFAGRDWILQLRVDTPRDTASRSWAAGTLLGMMLLFCGMISNFLLLNSGRALRTDELVARRTRELAKATARLRDQQSLLTQAQRIAHMGSWEIAADVEHLHMSEELRNLLELPPGKAIGEAEFIARVIAEDRPALAAAFAEVRMREGSRTLDCRMLDREETEQVLHFHVESEWQLEGLVRLFGTVQNVTSARAAEAHIQHLARFDSLTGLPNRTYWLEQARITLKSAERHGDQAAVLFLDLDHFKTINDSLGHQTGDLLLTSVARRLRDCLRAEDLLARQGGDEFVLMLPRVSDSTDVSRVAAKLVQSLAAPFSLDGHELAVSVSIGIAHYPGDAQDVDTLLKHADLAMYSAKQNGRNNYQFFVPEMNARAMQRLQLESALRLGIDRGELVLHFQPQQHMESGRIIACEALVRWQHPELGMVPPIQFIPMAEDSGLILPLGEWVLREACRQQVIWKNQGIHLTMAINIAALQFQQADFVERVAGILAETGAVAADIELEITESALLASTETLIGRLNQLRALGLSLALDDFGTGYSCLAYLKRLPIERLKIDRSFVKDLPGDTEDAAIASATLSMARDLGMMVTAEGVENEAQREWLLQRKCTLCQGYLISPPRPAGTLTEWLRKEMSLA